MPLDKSFEPSTDYLVECHLNSPWVTFRLKFLDDAANQKDGRCRGITETREKGASEASFCPGCSTQSRRKAEALELYQQALKKENLSTAHKDYAKMRIAQLTKTYEAKKPPSRRIKRY